MVAATTEFRSKNGPQLVRDFWNTRQIKVEAFVIYWCRNEWPCILQSSRSLLLNLHWSPSKHIKLMLMLFVCLFVFLFCFFVVFFYVKWSKTCATSSKIPKPFSRICNSGKRQLNGRQFVLVVVVVAKTLAFISLYLSAVVTPWSHNGDLSV